MRNDSVALREYCKQRNIGLLRCRKAGCWLLVFDTRPAAFYFFNLLGDLDKIGYDYVQDGRDIRYYIQIIKHKANE